MGIVSYGNLTGKWLLKKGLYDPIESLVMPMLSIAHEKHKKEIKNIH